MGNLRSIKENARIVTFDSRSCHSSRRAVFLDRDGVINADHGYVYRWEDFEFLPGAVDGMRRLHRAGYALVVVTNQSGIARGMYTEAEYQMLSQKMSASLQSAGAPLAGIFHCPHHPNGSIEPWNRECDCRKPLPGLILQACRALEIDLASSMLVGDKGSDILAARRAGVPRAYRIRSGYRDEDDPSARADGDFDDLSSFANAFLAEAK